jgi:hypothetical protein
MDYNYLIVLFKNKEKRKIINKFKTLKKTELVFNNLLKESNSIVFEKQFDNGFHSDYEIAIVQNNIDNNTPLYTKDEFGRQLKVELDNTNQKILKISKYKIEESLLDYQTKKKITVTNFIKKYLPKTGFKMISKINNKIVLQNDDNFKLFTLKNDLDSDRFVESVSNYFMEEKRTDCMFVKDTSTVQRKYLYNILVENGFPKSYLFRHSTTHPTKK